VAVVFVTVAIARLTARYVREMREANRLSSNALVLRDIRDMYGHATRLKDWDGQLIPMYDVQRHFAAVLATSGLDLRACRALANAPKDPSEIKPL
jgi:hypothetical protein